MNMDTVEEEDVPNEPDEMLGGDKSELEHKQLRQMAAGAVVTNADVEFNGMSIRQWNFRETKMTSEDYATAMRDNKWGGQRAHTLAVQ